MNTVRIQFCFETLDVVLSCFEGYMHPIGNCLICKGLVTKTMGLKPRPSRTALISIKCK